jgi:uncharacterized membrane protein YkoI
MKKHIAFVVSIVGLSAVSNPSYAADQILESCIKSIKVIKPGYIIKLEKLNVSGKGVYEIEVGDVNRGEWEFMCDSDSGKIIEKEAEVTDPNNQAFKKNVKVTEGDAAKIALKAYPGKIDEVEYEVEDNGGSSYEFDIVNDKGVETKVEVDAATGKIIETAVEGWEAGEETEEKR